MRAFKTLTAVAALTAGLALAASANAAIIIGVSGDGGATIGAPIVLPTGPTSVTFFGDLNGYHFSGNASEGLFPDLLFSNTIDTDVVGTTSGPLDIFVTVTDLSPASPLLNSNFTGNVTAHPLPVNLNTYYSPTNSPFGAGVQLGLAGVTFTSASQQTANVVAGVPASPLYSVTARYHVSGGLLGDSENSSVNISSAAPEPATWGLMIMGFGGLGALLRGRRRVQAALA